MCLYPRLIFNRKYTKTKKNKGIIPECTDERVKWVSIGCQKCMECKKQKARGWSIRLQEHIRTHKDGQFVTLTFSNEAITKLYNEITGLTGYDLDNEVATIAVRRFLERWRKKHKTSVTHWLITELGQSQGKHKGTENLHLHGIIFTNNKEDITKIWGYGFVYIGDYVNEKTVNYCCKYFTKTDPIHKEYTAKILTSPGIGGLYKHRINARLNAYAGKDTDETYHTRTGQKIALPIYYRNQIYTEQEREQLWIHKLDKKVRWINGKRISIAKSEETYYKLLQTAREKNKRLGYGDDSINWERKYYEQQRRNLMQAKRKKSLQNT